MILPVRCHMEIFHACRNPQNPTRLKKFFADNKTLCKILFLFYYHASRNRNNYMNMKTKTKFLFVCCLYFVVANAAHLGAGYYYLFIYFFIISFIISSPTVFSLSSPLSLLSSSALSSDSTLTLFFFNRDNFFFCFSAHLPHHFFHVHEFYV